jgi:cyanophycinase-like exopeptidase
VRRNNSDEVEDQIAATSGPGPLALVGSGEYLPQMADIEAALLAGRPARYVQLATAAVPDGPSVVERWHNLGIDQAKRLGVEAIILPVNDRAGADNAAIAEQIAGAGLIYLSGGNPAFLADTLRDTAVWEAIVEAWKVGAALAGCSAGAMAMTSWIPSLRHPRQGGTNGLGLLPHLRVIPHFDFFASKVPDLVTRFLLPHDPAITVLGIDEETALVGGPKEWTVQGRQSAWRLTSEGREELPAGTMIVTPTLA